MGYGRDMDSFVQINYGVGIINNLTNKLSSEIECFKKDPLRDHPNYDDYEESLETVLNQLKVIGNEYKRDEVVYDYSLNLESLEPLECESLIDYQKKYFPHYDGIFDKNVIEREIEESKSKLKRWEHWKSLEESIKGREKKNG